MRKRLSNLIKPRIALYQCVMFLLAGLALLVNPWLAGIQFCVGLLLLIHTHRAKRNRRKEMLRYVENLTEKLDIITKDNVTHSPLPVLMFSPEDGRVIWYNDSFLAVMESDERTLAIGLSAMAPDFDVRWLMEGKEQCPTEQQVKNRRFQVHGSLARTNQRGDISFIATTYWVDITDFSLEHERYIASRPTVAVVMLDNYEDLMRNLTDSQSSSILLEINQKLGDWVQGTGGIFRRYTRESYLLVLEHQHFQTLAQQKFEILDHLREIVSPSGVAATLSIGVGTDGESLEELLQFANLSIDMALSRGGDQVVIRNKFTFEFHGGRSAETEKRTKVKSRVMASTLGSLISDSSRVFVMGHKVPDMDAVGAAVGIFALARKKGTPSYLIKEPKEPNSAQPLYDKLMNLPEYHEKFLSTQEALLLADNRTLVVVVDTNRPDQVQSPEVLASCNRVAVIDHHRRASTYIEGAALNYHELYASSASELVAELLQYTLEPVDLLRVESEAMLAGIVLDTKNFTLRTGGRTFEAAAFLRRCGADTNEVKKLFQNDLESTVARNRIVQQAKVLHGDIAMAWTQDQVSRVVAAQAADELLNIRGIATSFVLFPGQGELLISGRSMGEVNVQMVLEPLGGGGNAAASGAQIPDTTLEEGISLLEKALEDYLKGD